MICTVTTQAGESDYTKAAQEYAISISEHLNARLRVVAKWQEDVVPAPIDTPSLAKNTAEEVRERAQDVGVAVLEEECDSLDGLLDEARVSDLFVVGMPTDTDVSEGDENVHDIQEAERPLLHEAECSVLAISKPPEGKIKNILVQYQGGIEGKSALRTAGELAKGFSAKVSILTLHGDEMWALKMASFAKDYLEGYALDEIEILENAGVPESWVDVKDAAESCSADMVVLGEDPYGLLDRLLTRNLGERMAQATDLPVLLAR